MRGSTELGSPSLALNVEVLRSPSLPDSGTPLWDSMSLPSSPSLRARVPDSTMDLNRWSKRGFSEDLALPPRQIEKPFRFLDLPAEIRNMIYELTFDRIDVSLCRNRNLWNCSCCWGCSCPWNHCCRAHLGFLKRQYQLSPIASVSKSIRTEAMSLYFATTDFTWYWDPLRVRCHYNNHGLPTATKFLADVMEFAATNGVQIKSVTVRSLCNCHNPTQYLAKIASSVRFLAPLRKSLDLTGRVHPALREFKFAEENSLARRIFNFAGSLESPNLKKMMMTNSQLRLFLRADPDGSELIRAIEIQERVNACEAQRQKKEATRRQNQAKGLERWNGVLRSRSATD
ncbi:unnamed protein product [Aureobasidium vineae]|uniref:F-box domain-containing protein n=1 Tax=Aureobasidium vineae TaxID=2773715 RepID=A0A9N8P8R3_9PEZI|nr:unnamed protein product [Aureobasidium vineae]